MSSRCLVEMMEHLQDTFIAKWTNIVTRIAILTGRPSRLIAEKTGHPGLVMKVMNHSWDVLFAKRTGIVTLYCGAQLCTAPHFAQKYAYSNLQSLTE